MTDDLVSSFTTLFSLFFLSLSLSFDASNSSFIFSKRVFASPPREQTGAPISIILVKWKQPKRKKETRKSDDAHFFSSLLFLFIYIFASSLLKMRKKWQVKATATDIQTNTNRRNVQERDERKEKRRNTGWYSVELETETISLKSSSLRRFRRVHAASHLPCEGSRGAHANRQNRWNQKPILNRALSHAIIALLVTFYAREAIISSYFFFILSIISFFCWKIL